MDSGFTEIVSDCGACKLEKRLTENISIRTFSTDSLSGMQFYFKDKDTYEDSITPLQFMAISKDNFICCS